MNATDIEGSGSSSMDEFLPSMNTSNPMEQEADPSGGSSVYGQERCRDRVLIPCDFEEFITVMFSLCLGARMAERGVGWIGEVVGFELGSRALTEECLF